MTQFGGIEVQIPGVLEGAHSGCDSDIVVSTERQMVADSDKTRTAQTSSGDIEGLSPKIAAELEEMKKLGTASYNRWPTYAWKNEIKLQLERISQHFAEMLDDDYVGEHSPFDMIDRALGVMAFCTRRMVERKLITDVLAKEQFPVRTIEATGDYRPILHAHSGTDFFKNYDATRSGTQLLTIKGISEEIIHSSQLIFLANNANIPDGLVVASDWHHTKRALHFTLEDLTEHFQRVLDDRVRSYSDYRDFDTGKVTSTRE